MDAISADYLKGIVNFSQSNTGQIDWSQYNTGKIDWSQYDIGQCLDFSSTSSILYTTEGYPKLYTTNFMPYGVDRHEYQFLDSEYYTTYYGRPIFVGCEQQDDVVIDKEEMEKLI